MSRNAEPPTHRPQALTVARGVTDVVESLRTNLAGVVETALGPFTAIFLTEGCRTLLDRYALAESAKTVGPIHFLALCAGLLASAVLLVATAMFVVDCHRRFLLGSASVPSAPRLWPNRRDFQYVWRSLLVGLCVALALALPLLILARGFLAIPGGFVVLTLVVGLLGLTGMLALGLKLPATAIDRDYGIGASWRATRNVLPAILGLVIVLLAPLSAVAMAFGSLHALVVAQGLPAMPSLLLLVVFQFAQLTVFATLFSVIYKQRSGVDITV